MLATAIFMRSSVQTSPIVATLAGAASLIVYLSVGNVASLLGLDAVYLLPIIWLPHMPGTTDIAHSSASSSPMLITWYFRRPPVAIGPASASSTSSPVASAPLICSLPPLIVSPAVVHCAHAST